MLHCSVPFFTSSCRACQTLPETYPPVGHPAPPAARTTEDNPADGGRQGCRQAWIPGGALGRLSARAALAMPPCRDLCNVGIGIDYGDCVVACWALSRDFTTVPCHPSATLFRNKLRGRPFRAPAFGMPDDGVCVAVWLPSCPSTQGQHSKGPQRARISIAVPAQPAYLGQNCSEGGGY